MRQSISMLLFGFFVLCLTLPLSGQKTADAATYTSSHDKTIIKVFSITHGDAGELKSVVDELHQKILAKMKEVGDPAAEK